MLPLQPTQAALAGTTADLDAGADSHLPLSHSSPCHPTGLTDARIPPAASDASHPSILPTALTHARMPPAALDASHPSARSCCTSLEER